LHYEGVKLLILSLLLTAISGLACAQTTPIYFFQPAPVGSERPDQDNLVVLIFTSDVTIDGFTVSIQWYEGGSLKSLTKAVARGSLATATSFQIGRVDVYKVAVKPYRSTGEIVAATPTPWPPLVH
jgi:hypothetical protein